jgi:hypothetical protein
MPTHNGEPVTQRGGADAGRGDDAHGVTANAGMNNYKVFQGTHPDDPETEHNFEVQIQKGKGKYVTVFSGNKAAQAGMMYHGRNVGEGFTKRILKNGVVTHTTRG